MAVVHIPKTGTLMPHNRKDSRCLQREEYLDSCNEQELVDILVERFDYEPDDETLLSTEKEDLITLINVHDQPAK